MTPISIIIPTYNGLELLKRIVPSVLDLVKSPEDHEILVVDDGSEDGTENYLRNYFPQVKVITLERNIGFGKACNIGVSKARNGLVMILNNDVLIGSDFLPNVFIPLTKQENGRQEIFAATCKVLKEDRKTPYYCRNEGIFSAGEIAIKVSADERGSTFFASGVIIAFRKEIFLELGGFDDLYHPFYWEDVDICYRAQKNGYHILYDPTSMIYHKDQGTIVFRNKGRFELFFAKMHARIIQERNQYLFTWKNILDRGLIFRHILWFPVHLLLSLWGKDHIFKPIGFLFALARLNKALIKRKEERLKEYPLRDRQILTVGKAPCLRGMDHLAARSGHL